jgi:hypothetical protein
MKWLLAAVAFAMLISSAAHAGQSRRTVECRGVPVEVEMVERADFLMAVIYDNSDLTARTCVLDLGRAGQWPFRGARQPGEQCRLTGP